MSLWSFQPVGITAVLDWMPSEPICWTTNTLPNLLTLQTPKIALQRLILAEACAISFGKETMKMNALLLTWIQANRMHSGALWINMEICSYAPTRQFQSLKKSGQKPIPLLMKWFLQSTHLASPQKCGGMRSIRKEIFCSSIVTELTVPKQAIFPGMLSPRTLIWLTNIRFAYLFWFRRMARQE